MFTKNKPYIISILTLALPVMIENILQTLLGTTDMFFAGQLGDDAIAAISVVNLIMNIWLAFYLAISIGISAFLGRYIGRGEYVKASEIVKQAIMLGAAISIVIGAISFVFYQPILASFQLDEAVMQYAVPYYMAVVMPSVFLCLSLILSSCLRATKNTKIPMLAIGFANVLNMILSYIFMKCGFGIIGLGVATTFARAVTVIILLVYLYRKETIIPITFKKWEWNVEYVRSIIKIGVPAGLEKAIMRIGQVVYGTMILSLGKSSFVAHNIAGTIENYSYIPSVGFGVAATVLVAICLGEDNPLKARKITAIVYSMTASVMVVVGILFFMFAPQIASMFSPTEEVQVLIVTVLRLIAFFQPVSALTHILTGALQGAGDTKFPMYTTFLGIWGIRVGFGYILAVICGFGLLGVWVAYAIDLSIRGILLLMRFLHGKWQRIVI